MRADPRIARRKEYGTHMNTNMNTKLNTKYAANELRKRELRPEIARFINREIYAENQKLDHVFSEHVYTTNEALREVCVLSVKKSRQQIFQQRKKGRLRYDPQDAFES